MVSSFWRLAGGIALAVTLALPLAGTAQQQERSDPAKQQAERQQTQPLNNAPLWREVRSGTPAYTSIQGRETNVLIQARGQDWRAVRVPLATIGGALIAFAVLALIGFYGWRGSIGLHDRPTGRLIQRFSPADRIVHWSMAISFVILAITGLIITFGKYVLLPVIGYTLFSWLAIFSKSLHNFVGPIFSVTVPVFIVLYIRDNLPKASDWEWVVKFGGMLNKQGGHVPSGRFNAGEKAMFWGLVCFFAIILIVTGYVLDFPNFDQTRNTMQIANVVHMIAAMLGIAMAFFHIYLGTIGMKGAYQAMRTGYVDESWAKEHHGYWYDEIKAGKSRQQFATDVPRDTRTQIASVLQ